VLLASDPVDLRQSRAWTSGPPERKSPLYSPFARDSAGNQNRASWVPRLLEEYIGDYALVETTKRILVEILVREPFVGGNRLQVSRPDETRSRTGNCQCAAYYPDRAERDLLHELVANHFSSVARNYVEEAYQIKSVFPMDN